MIIETGRFGQVSVTSEEIIQVPQGILGFPDDHEYCLVDPGDETMILWLQSLRSPAVAFPVLEPKVFMPSYAAKLSAAELRELKLDTVNQSAVFSILTIPEDITQMTANLKAPMVINLKDQLAKQVVLQDNHMVIKHPMFKELRAHLITIRSYQAAAQARLKPATSRDAAQTEKTHVTRRGVPVSIADIPPSLTVRSPEL